MQNLVAGAPGTVTPLKRIRGSALTYPNLGGGTEVRTGNSLLGDGGSPSRIS